ncbi:hypothetical protein L873DRAFT_324067 [Choiromyces venosus 120613-1]|uniref:Uncharacterized protein n=1 Tax=Choiromyces venosus 120613-1 TaxID=1336337 RepID=A0A3N4JXE1_9PEZI|nr:hypothetical protein L873DRAFT_324067 [Choiromyces venosus 120613-1]
MNLHIPHPPQTPTAHESALVRRTPAHATLPALVTKVCAITLLAPAQPGRDYARGLEELVEVVVGFVLIRHFDGAGGAVYVCCGAASARGWWGGGGMGEAGRADPAAAGLAVEGRGLSAVLSGISLFARLAERSGEEDTLQASSQHPARPHIFTSMSSFGFSARSWCWMGFRKYIPCGKPQQGGPGQILIHRERRLWCAFGLRRLRVRCKMEWARERL